MKIKIEVTEEMLAAYDEGFYSTPVMRKVGNRQKRVRDGITRVLAIVERDLNDAEPEVNPERLGGCVMIETEECE